jgi:hypothetical protein
MVVISGNHFPVIAWVAKLMRATYTIDLFHASKIPPLLSSPLLHQQIHITIKRWPQTLHTRKRSIKFNLVSWRHMILNLMLAMNLQMTLLLVGSFKPRMFQHRISMKQSIDGSASSNLQRALLRWHRHQTVLRSLKVHGKTLAKNGR